ncbi:MAG: alpha-L-fucosidase [Pseudomonadota bacterium]
MRLSRRALLGSGLAAALPRPAIAAPGWGALQKFGYRAPDWFRDAKFGIWAHWGPQCQPEYGDWYARLMYLQGRQPWQQGETPYENHLRRYGHPSRTGFIDIIGKWKAEHWEPETLVRRYARAGARYFFAMGCHHDNFDNFASSHHEWNSTRVGPKRDILGTWAPIVRAAGLKFGISNHASHAWHWWQPAYGYDAEGPMRGRRYDAYWLRKHHGRGKYWDGLDPQELYTGPYYVAPDGITSAQAMNAWHDERDGQWIEVAPPANPRFVEKWRMRQKEMVEKYRPDLFYFDDSGIPFGETGLEAVRHYYEQAVQWRGSADVVLFAKKLGAFERRFIVEDVERGFVDQIRPEPWQTDTCIGSWHYDRPLYERGGYKSAEQVVQRLADVVSKNGNLLLSIPVRGDGTIDEKEEAIVDAIGAWNQRNGEAIFGSRPWRVFGEGPAQAPTGHMAEDQAKPFTAEDVRFTSKDGALYAILLAWPERETAIGSLGTRALPDAVIERIDLLGGPDLPFKRDGEALRLTLPPAEKGAFVPVLRIRGRGLA